MKEIKKLPTRTLIRQFVFGDEPKNIDELIAELKRRGVSGYGWHSYADEFLTKKMDEELE